MNQGLRHLRVPLRFVALFVASALVLAACGETAVAKAHLNGTPAISISVPLSEVSCTLNDVCVAAGTASDGNGPTSVAEFSSPKGHWFNLELPDSSPLLLSSVACSGAQCLLGGSQPGHDELWTFNTHGDALTSVVPPASGIGVSALTCNALVCGMIDTAATGEPRFSMSTDEGTSWTIPVPLAWANDDAITAFSCGNAEDCALGVLSVHHQFSLYTTINGGTTWTQSTTPSTWTTLTSLSCVGVRCVALAKTSNRSLIVRSKNFARSWTSAALARPTASLACLSFTRCVAVGQRSSNEPWLATIRNDRASDISLRYVPSALLGVACGSKVCAAIGVTTLISVPARI